MAIIETAGFQSAETAEELLIDIAHRVQLSATKHDLAVGHYEALCKYVDRPGSPLEGLVVTCYPSGSFGIGAVVASKVKTNQHDLDVVIELNVPITTPAVIVLMQLFQAIRGEEGSRYYHKTTLNSRCVTVEYDDGFKVDLMPIVRDQSLVERRGVLFHYKDGEGYTKPVNPYGFRTLYNATVKTDPTFVTEFRKSLTERTVAKAETEPMDDLVRLEEKSPRTVALQLLKRMRDVRYRRPSHKGRRKPPSVMLAAYALQKPIPRHSLLWELIDQIKFVGDALAQATAETSLVDVRNPAWSEDRFTDRWPASMDDQCGFERDLRELGAKLETVARDAFSPVNTKAILEELFGETAADYAINEAMVRKSRQADRGELKFGQTGQVLAGAAAAAAPASRAATRTSTDFGGDDR